MAEEKTRLKPSKHQDRPAPASNAADEPPSDLRQQAAAFAAVAREAHRACEKGAAAELELARRRNRSGQ